MTAPSESSPLRALAETTPAPKRRVIHSASGTKYEGHKRMTRDEYNAVLEATWGPDPLHWRVVCPSCGTTQSMQELFDVEPKATTPDEKNRRARLIGFSCIGRLTGAGGAFNREKWAPCNYTSGGLFRINTLVVECDGKDVPAFEPAEKPAEVPHG